MRKYYDQITEIAGSVVKVTAPGVAYDELAAITTSRETSLAQVIRLEGDQVSLQVFAGTQGISTGDKVRFFGRPMQVPFTPKLMGRAPAGRGTASRNWSNTASTSAPRPSTPPAACARARWSAPASP